MTSRKLQASRAAIELVKQFEGYRRAAAQLDDGRWTIGYGHTKTARAGAEVSEADAEALLIYDLMEIAAAVNRLVLVPLTQNQFDALAAFVFNIGIDSFQRSAVLKRLNEGNYLLAACAMEMWRRADFEGEQILLDALVRRRAAEKALFLTPESGFIPAPSSVLRPRLDLDRHGTVPAEAPVEVTTSLDGERAVAARVEPEQVGPAGAGETEDAAASAAEAGPTASEIAVDAVTARLQSILNDTPAPEPEPAPGPAQEAEAAVAEEAVSEPEAAPEPAVEPEPEPVPEPEPEPAPVRAPTPFEEPAATTSLAADAALSERLVQDSETATRSRLDFDPTPELDSDRPHPLRAFGRVPSLLGLGLFGLVVFAAGLFWSFNARQEAEGGMFSGPALAGLIVGTIGIACVAVAVYFLLERLGGEEG